MSEHKKSEKLPAPYYADESVTLYHADCLDVLRALPAEAFDAVITDPPYNAVNRDTGGLRSINKGGADSLEVSIPHLAAEFVRLASGTIYVWCSDNQFSGWTVAFKDAGLTTRIALWHKSNPSPMNGTRLWLSGVELCVFARKPRAPFYRKCESPVWRGATERKVRWHPTPKPLWLMETLVEASVPDGGIVLDPFAGSGSTLVACAALNRRAVGVEMDDAYCEQMAKTLESLRAERAA